MALVLASKSPRRRELIALVSPGFLIDTAHLDEAALATGTPPEAALAVGTAKAGMVFARRSSDVVVGCDTVVEVDGDALGKPRSREEAVAMLGRLSGRQHLVHTGVGICRPGASAPDTFVETTVVNFSPIPPDEIAAYAATAEPYDKAGGYGVQGWAARYITGVTGDFFNVMGLPVAALYRRLRRMGVL